MSHVEGWFESVYTEQYPKMIRLAYYILHDEELAEDAVQSAFMTLLIKEESLRRHSDISKWLKITLRNVANNELSKAKYKMEIPFPPGYEAAGAMPEEDFLSLLPQGLSEKERRLLYLRVEMGYSLKEIAEMEHCTPEACRMRLWRIRQKCKELLQ